MCFAIIKGKDGKTNVPGSYQEKVARLKVAGKKKQQQPFRRLKHPH